MVERCGDRQRKCDGLEKWPFHMFIGSLPVMLQIALLLLACGLCRYMVSVNTTVAYILFPLTGLGVLFYVGIVIAGASSYDCPFQTPVSAPLRSLWKEIGPRLISVSLLILRTLGGIVQRRVCRVIRVNICPPVHHQLLPSSLGHPPRPMEVIPWFAPGELANIRMKNTNDVRCVSWVIKNITDPEALDTAIQRAGTIRWFDDGIDVKPVYDLIVSTFHACFGSNMELYPGSRDRAYYSGRAILWIHTLSMCKQHTFPLPKTPYYRATGFDDLQQLLEVTRMRSADDRFVHLSRPRPGPTPSHSRWVSCVLLHQSWARIQRCSSWIHYRRHLIDEIVMPLGALSNLLLMCCNLLGFPIEEEALEIQDTSYDIFCPFSSGCLCIIR